MLLCRIAPDNADGAKKKPFRDGSTATETSKQDEEVSERAELIIDGCERSRSFCVVPQEDVNECRCV